MGDYNMDSDITIESLAIRSILSNRTLFNPMKVPSSNKDKDFDDVYADASAAFLGPNIWDKSSEFKMDYLDLDALLNGVEPASIKISDPNAINNTEKSEQHQMSAEIQSLSQEIPNLPPAMHPSRHIPSPSVDSCSLSDIQSDTDNRVYSSDSDRLYVVDCKFSPRDLALATGPGQNHYDPASTVFPEEELKPQPIIKKSRKNFVPDKLKDDKYWARRHKNNIAARRSREARRLKENQIVLRASYLEKENNTLKEDVMRLKAENDMLKNELKKLQS